MQNNDFFLMLKLKGQTLKHNHLIGQNFKYVNLHYQQNIYTPNINLSKFEP